MLDTTVITVIRLDALTESVIVAQDFDPARHMSLEDWHAPLALDTDAGRVETTLALLADTVPHDVVRDLARREVAAGDGDRLVEDAMAHAGLAPDAPQDPETDFAEVDPEAFAPDRDDTATEDAQDTPEVEPERLVPPVEITRPETPKRGGARRRKN